MAILSYRALNITNLLFTFNLIVIVLSRKHTLELKDDVRSYFELSSFGFFEDGVMEIHMKKFSFSSDNMSYVFGFSLDKTYSNAISPYLENHQEECVLEEEKRDLEMMSVTFFTMDLNEKKLKITCSEGMKSLHIQYLVDETQRKQRATSDKLSDSFLIRNRRDKEGGVIDSSSTTEVTKKVVATTPASASDEKNATTKKDGDSSAKEEKVKTDKVNTEKAKEEFIGRSCGSGFSIPIQERKEKDLSIFETGFIIRIIDPSEEGLYSLYFHNCPNYKRSGGKPTKINLTIEMTEVNDENFLSAGQMPLPTVYFCSSMLFFFAGCIWVYVLKHSNASDIFKIHYLMASLVFIKSLSQLFHGINYYFIETSGTHIETWAVLYYITHLLKGALLFITIVLIGTGWALIKHIINDKEKKIFMIVIPLQVLANVAEIIIEESEEGDLAYSAWREVLIMVDLLCCGAILFPVVWSIRHLQEASQTDGKAAINLNKLKLFRHFYIMIVCYIYFTRIIVYLLKITVPFKYEWLDEVFRAAATLIFFVMTGYKFRPASNNPYLQLRQDDDEVEMEEVLTGGGVLDGVSKLRKQTSENKESTKQESSHEYD